MKKFEALYWASSFLEANGQEGNAAMHFMLHVLKCNQTTLYATFQEEIEEEAFLELQQLVRQHGEVGTPIQYIIGKESFYGRDFTVTESTLIPRPETEELVLGVLTYIQKNKLQQATVVDIGTGTGAIAITLKQECPSLTVHAVDISDKALEVATENAKMLGAEITFHHGSFLAPIVENNITPTIIVSNPPYIKEEDWKQLHRTVRDFEPKLALVADEDGTYCYRNILEEIYQANMNPHLIAFEIGYDQGRSVEKLARDIFPEKDVTVQKDINGKDRMVYIR